MLTPSQLIILFIGIYLTYVVFLVHKYFTALNIKYKWEKVEKETGLYWTSYLGIERFIKRNKLVLRQCQHCKSVDTLDINTKCKICNQYNTVKNSFSRKELLEEGITNEKLNQLKCLALLRQNYSNRILRIKEIEKM